MYQFITAIMASILLTCKLLKVISWTHLLVGIFAGIPSSIAGFIFIRSCFLKHSRRKMISVISNIAYTKQDMSYRLLQLCVVGLIIATFFLPPDLWIDGKF